MGCANSQEELVASTPSNRRVVGDSSSSGLPGGGMSVVPTVEMAVVGMRDNQHQHEEEQRERSFMSSSRLETPGGTNDELSSVVAAEESRKGSSTASNLISGGGSMGCEYTLHEVAMTRLYIDGQGTSSSGAGTATDLSYSSSGNALSGNAGGLCGNGSIVGGVRSAGTLSAGPESSGRSSGSSSGAGVGGAATNSSLIVNHNDGAGIGEGSWSCMMARSGSTTGGGGGSGIFGQPLLEQQPCSELQQQPLMSFNPLSISSSSRFHQHDHNAALNNNLLSISSAPGIGSSSGSSGHSSNRSDSVFASEFAGEHQLGVLAPPIPAAARAKLPRSRASEEELSLDRGGGGGSVHGVNDRKPPRGQHRRGSVPNNSHPPSSATGGAVVGGFTMATTTVFLADRERGASGIWNDSSSVIGSNCLSRSCSSSKSGDSGGVGVGSGSRRTVEGEAAAGGDDQHLTFSSISQQSRSSVPISLVPQHDLHSGDERGGVGLSTTESNCSTFE